VALALIERGASLYAKTRSGLTPLHMATQADHLDCIRILIASGAPVDDVSVVRVYYVTSDLYYKRQLVAG